MGTYSEKLEDLSKLSGETVFYKLPALEIVIFIKLLCKVGSTLSRLD